MDCVWQRRTVIGDRGWQHRFSGHSVCVCKTVWTRLWWMVIPHGNSISVDTLCLCVKLCGPDSKHSWCTWGLQDTYKWFLNDFWWWHLFTGYSLCASVIVTVRWCLVISDGNTVSLDILCVWSHSDCETWCPVRQWLVISDGDTVSLYNHCVLGVGDCETYWLVISDGDKISLDIHCVLGVIVTVKHSGWWSLMAALIHWIFTVCIKLVRHSSDHLFLMTFQWTFTVWMKHGSDWWYLMATPFQWTFTVCMKHCGSSETWLSLMIPDGMAEICDTWSQHVGGQLLCVWNIVRDGSDQCLCQQHSLCAWNVGEMWRRLLWYLMAALFLWIFTVCIKRVTVMWLVILMAWQRLVVATPFHWTFTVGINCWWDMAETGGPVGNTVSVYLLFCAYSMGGETRQCL